MITCSLGLARPLRLLRNSTSALQFGRVDSPETMLGGVTGTAREGLPMSINRGFPPVSGVEVVVRVSKVNHDSRLWLRPFF